MYYISCDDKKLRKRQKKLQFSVDRKNVKPNLAAMYNNVALITFMK